MANALPPALTPQQWNCIEGRDVTITPNQWPYNREFWKKLFVRRPFDWGDSHGLAALCLYDQPYGFTREDVVGLRAMAEAIADDFSPDDPFLLSLANRIAALLPPE